MTTEPHGRTLAEACYEAGRGGTMNDKHVKAVHRSLATGQAIGLSYGGTPKKRRPLLDIVADVRNAIDHADGEITDAVDALGLELEDKIEACCVVLAEIQAEASENALLADHYEARKKAADARRERLRERMHYALDQAGVEKLKTATCSVWFQESKSVEVEDDEALVEKYVWSDFVRTDHSVDKTAIREALDRGEHVEGAKLVTTKRLRVR